MSSIHCDGCGVSFSTQRSLSVHLHIHEACQVGNRHRPNDEVAHGTSVSSNEEEGEGFVGYNLDLTEEQQEEFDGNQFAVQTEELVMIKLLDLLGIWDAH